MCCTEIYCIHWDKDVKYASPSTKGFLQYLSWNSMASKVYFVYVPSMRKIISSYDIVFDESFSRALSYNSQSFAEAMHMRLYVKYTPCAVS